MKALELFESYSKTATVIRQWYLSKLLEELKDQSLPEDFKQHVRDQGIDDERICKMIEASPRSLFDVFDDHKVCVEIFLYPTYTFGYKIEGHEPITSFPTRKEAENAAIEDAFELLNNKL